ncbi:hypothetical protein LTR53_002742 [Teratosphaeriaceae sp. CCFEE 6253]|nr:hypothetical protein LTR53_002742 [Teratosphaeriaceae sp. CCFEE 6253]
MLRGGVTLNSIALVFDDLPAALQVTWLARQCSSAAAPAAALKSILKLAPSAVFFLQQHTMPSLHSNAARSDLPWPALGNKRGVTVPGGEGGQATHQDTRAPTRPEQANAAFQQTSVQSANGRDSNSESAPAVDESQGATMPQKSLIQTSHQHTGQIIPAAEARLRASSASTARSLQPWERIDLESPGRRSIAYSQEGTPEPRTREATPTPVEATPPHVEAEAEMADADRPSASFSDDEIARIKREWNRAGRSTCDQRLPDGTICGMHHPPLLHDDAKAKAARLKAAAVASAKQLLADHAPGLLKPVISETEKAAQQAARKTQKSRRSKQKKDARKAASSAAAGGISANAPAHQQTGNDDGFQAVTQKHFCPTCRARHVRGEKCFPKQCERCHKRHDGACKKCATCMHYHTGPCRKAQAEAAPQPPARQAAPQPPAGQAAPEPARQTASAFGAQATPGAGQWTDRDKLLRFLSEDVYDDEGAHRLRRLIRGRLQEPTRSERPPQNHGEAARRGARGGR